MNHLRGANDKLPKAPYPLYDYSDQWNQKPFHTQNPSQMKTD